MSKHNIEEIVSHSTLDFERAYGIIQERIPFEERSDIMDFIKTLDDAKAGLLHPDNYHMLITTRDSEVLGAITGYYISEINCGFVNTLAVRARYASEGIGTNLREELIRRFKKDSKKSGKKLNGILGEVEESNPWLRKIIANQRVFLFDIAYIQPPLREKQAERKLVLYLQGNRILKRIHRDKVAKIITSIYRNIYDIEVPDNNLFFRKIIKSFENRRYISKKII